MNNFIHLKGRIGKDAEIKVTNTGKTCVSFSMAVYNGKTQNGDSDTFWINVTGIDYEHAERLTKGTTVAVDGKLEVNQYKDNSGAYKTNVRVITFGFDSITPEYREQQTQPRNYPQGGQYSQNRNYNQNNGGYVGGPEDFNDDNVPF